MFPYLLFDAELVLSWLTHAAWQAGLLAIVVLALTWLLERRLQPRWRFALWLIVFARLAAPVLPEASWSVFRIVSLAGALQPAAIGDSSPTRLRQISDGQMKLPTDDSRDLSLIAPANPPGIHESAELPANGKAGVLAAGDSRLLLTQFATLIWIAGVGVFSLRRLANVVQLRRRQRHWQKITDPDVLSVLRNCSSELRLVRGVSLYTAPDNLGPATCGVVHPRIVLPQILLDRLSREELRLVLLHELVHVRRHDVLVDQLTGLVTILHWFDPIAWIGRYFLRRERELACDAAVLEQSPVANATEYGHVILKTIESLAAPLAPLPGLVGIFSRRQLSLVHRRIRLIAEYRRSTWTSPLLGGALLFALMLVGLTDAQSQQKQADPAQKPAASPKQSRPAAKAQAAKDAVDKDDSTYSVPITVAGRALDRDEKPITGAEIFLASPRTHGQPLATTKTDDDGNYRFEKVPLSIKRADTNAGKDVGSFEVFGRAAGFGISWRPLKWFYPDSDHVDGTVNDPTWDLPYRYGRKDPIELDIYFDPATTLQGRLVNDLDEPLADARLEIRRGQPVADKARNLRNLESFNWPALVPEGIKVRRTDKDGRFEFTDLPENHKFWIDLKPAGYTPRSFWAATANGFVANVDGEQIYNGDIEVVFPRPRRVKLRIICGDTEQPAVKVGVAGANLLETTNDAGAVEVPLPDGEYRLLIYPRFGTDYLNTQFDIVVSADSVQQPTIVKLRPAAVVDVTVVDADTGAPLAGADVWLEKDLENGQARRNVHGYRSWEVETRISHYDAPRSGKDGKMRVLLEPGKRRIGVGLEAYPKGYEPADPDGKVIDCEAGAPTPVEFAMRKQTAAGPPPQAPAPELQPAKAGDAVKKQSAPVAAKDAVTPQIRHHPLTVTGKAVDQDGKPIAGATILLVATNNSPRELLGQTMTDRDGRYEFRNKELPYYIPEKDDAYEHGTFQVFGKAPGLGFAWRGMRFLHIDPRFIDENGKSLIGSPSHGYFPGDAIDLDLAFPPAKPIRGRFVDDQGRPIQDVKVSLTDCDYFDTTGKEAKASFRELRDAAEQVRRAMPDQLKGVSDADGRFELNSVPEGIVCRLVMEHPEYGTWAICTATVDSLPKKYDGADVQPLPIEMTRQKTRSISVRVHYADTREPCVGALVGAYLKLGTNNAWGNSDNQGKVMLKLPPDEYIVWSHPPKGADYLTVDSKFVVRPTDEEQAFDLFLDRACVLVLKALDASTGAGVEKVTFWYEKESQPGKKWSVQSNDTTNDFPVTNANGELRAIVPPGTRRYGIRFNPLPENYQPDNGDATIGRELKLLPGHIVTSEFLLRK